MSQFKEEKLIIEESFGSIVEEMLTKSIPANPNIGELPGLFEGGDFYNLSLLQKKYGEGWVRISEILKEYLAQKNGKRMRPILFLLGYKTFSQNKKPGQEIVDVAVGVELLHESALILDDIMDNSLLRRGTPSLWSAIEEGTGVSQGEAKKIAANLGALCFSWSRYLIVDKSNKKIKSSISKIFWKAVDSMKKGQVMDVNSASASVWPKLEEALEWEYLKTATYSIELPLLLSLYLAGVDDKQEEVAKGIKTFAWGFGLAFQLKDDLLMFKADKEIGKESMADAVNGNKIPLAIIARNLGSDEQKKFLDLAWGHPDELTAENIEKLKNVFKETGALEAITQMILGELENAKKGLQKIKEAGFDTEALEKFI